MKKIILVGCILLFAGCSAMDATYGKAKKVYKDGKWVYKHQPLKSNTLEAISTGAEHYDDLRSEVRGK